MKAISIPTKQPIKRLQWRRQTDRQNDNKAASKWERYSTSKLIGERAARQVTGPVAGIVAPYVKFPSAVPTARVRGKSPFPRLVGAFASLLKLSASLGNPDIDPFRNDVFVQYLKTY
jgi:hypothetical protein